MPTSRLSFLILAAATAGLAIAAPALAESTQTISAEIQYDNSALHTRAGADNVLDSVQDQALVICRYGAPVSTAPRIDETCVEHVIAQTVNKIDQPKLTEAYLSRSDLPARLVADRN